MRAHSPLALLPVVCICLSAIALHSQNAPNSAPSSPQAGQSHAEVAHVHATGRIAGVLKDPSGALLPGAKVTVRGAGIERTLISNGEGQFVFEALAAGSYEVTVHASGFETTVLHDLSVQAGGETAANLALKIAPAKSLVVVNGTAIDSSNRQMVDDGDLSRSRNAAELIENAPGVTLRDNGQLASVPLLHGLGDERTKLLVNGITVSAACANHMNPPMSYISPSQVSAITVMAGITPVSLGGDSTGGTISIESPRPVFAAAGERFHAEGTVSGFYRSNGNNYGGSLSEWMSGGRWALGYTGSWTDSDNYTDGGGHLVTSTYAQSTDHALTLAYQGARDSLAVEAGLHHTPYQGFPNAQMDMVRNYAESVNLHYHRTLEGGGLDARAYWQGTWHTMNIGQDKSTFPMPMWMPMDTHGRDLGYTLGLDVPLTDRHTLRVGNELHRFVLDDKWPAVAGTAPHMAPNTFVSMNAGHRLQLGTYVELVSKWSKPWTTVVGLRNDTVWSNAGAVQGYSAMYAADASAFNALKRAKTDANLDATASVRYEPNLYGSYEFGYSRKTRSPNLYERYAWSTNMMASGMIGWFGDGNYYVGNVNLKPETANTLSGTANWHGGSSAPWAIKFMPYITDISDYVDVDSMKTKMYGMSTFAQLRFANHNAKIYGVDLSGSATIWSSPTTGVGKFSGVAGWLHGERKDTSTGLYQMMPPHLSVAFDEELKGFTGGIGLQAVGRKSRVDPLRLEQVTPGYLLLNVHAGYSRSHIHASAAAENLTNKNYALPLGGVNFDDFMASMWMNQIKPLTGRGRSLSFSLTAQF